MTGVSASVRRRRFRLIIARIRSHMTACRLANICNRPEQDSRAKAWHDMLRERTHRPLRRRSRLRTRAPCDRRRRDPSRTVARLSVMVRGRSNSADRTPSLRLWCRPRWHSLFGRTRVDRAREISRLLPTVDISRSSRRLHHESHPSNMSSSPSPPPPPRPRPLLRPLEMTSRPREARPPGRLQHRPARLR